MVDLQESELRESEEGAREQALDVAVGQSAGTCKEGFRRGPTFCFPL